MAAFGRFLDVLDTLREQCPWDKKQTNESLRPNTIEETFELCDALMKDDTKDICKELGDVLLHVAFYARIASEKEQFDIADVCDRLVEKLKFRHPHIYGDVQAQTADEVSRNWEQIKQKEKDGNKTVMSGIPDAMPAVLKAMSMQEKARGCGFDWERREDVWDKVQEEFGEVREACAEKDGDHVEEEFGDLMFAVINAARLYGVDPEKALGRTCTKFRRRFDYVEAEAKSRRGGLAGMTLAEMDALWDEAKSRGL